MDKSFLGVINATMPNRIVREGIITSELVNSLSWAEEVFYRRLHSVVDDFGRFSANLSLLRAALFPLRLNDVSDQDVGKWLAACATKGLVRVYEVEGRRFLEVTKFNQRTRAGASKYPAPETHPPNDSQMSDQRPSDDGHLSDTRPSSAHVVGDGDVKNTLPPFSGGFLRFWGAWPRGPRKKAQGRCWEVWRKRDFDQLVSEIVAHVEAMKQTDDWRKGYVCAPLVYLNQRHWEGAEGVGEKAIESPLYQRGGPM